MRRQLSVVLLSIFTLCACSGPAAPPPVSGGDRPAATETPAGRDLGHYTIGDTRVPLREALVAPGETGELVVLLTPTALLPEERAALLEEGWPWTVLMQKNDGGYPDRYPFVSVKLYVDGEIAPSNVRSSYIMAQSIAQPNHTDNINGLPNAVNRVERLELQGDRLILEFSGQEEIGGELRSWAFDIPGLNRPPKRGQRT